MPTASQVATPWSATPLTTYSRQQQINARSGVHTPRSTLAAWAGQGGGALRPLFEVHREFVPGAQVLRPDETPVNMLDPGAGKTERAYVWAYAQRLRCVAGRGL